MTCVRANISPPIVRKDDGTDSTRHPGLGWLARLTFVLCGAIVLFIAVHGDEHGRRPRFVWQSYEQTVKAAMLQAVEPFARRTADAAPGSSSSVHVFLADLPLGPRGRPLLRPTPQPRLATAPAWLLPFANGPPAQA
jgi:hypothetical protein